MVGQTGSHGTRTTEFIDVGWIGDPLDLINSEVLVRHASSFDINKGLGGGYHVS